MPTASGPVYQVKITLKNLTPPIWRRILVSSETTLAQFHPILQTVMGWEDSHLYVFKAGSVQFTYPYEPGDLEEMTAVDARAVKLIHLVPGHRPFHGQFHYVLEYEYDLGDGWEHELVFEDVLAPDPNQKLPLCLAGERACPPEDVGGVRGYADFLDAIRLRDHPEHDQYMEWSGGSFDPERFNMKAVNSALRKLKAQR